MDSLGYVCQLEFMARPTVLVVDDDPQILELYRNYLESEYDVRTAMYGDEALDQLDDEIDVVLLDRRMPDLSGDEVLQRIRDQEYDCRVAMVTAVEPDFDLLDLGFDDYVVKPVTRDELLDLVEALESRSAYDDPIQEWLALLSKQAMLSRLKSSSELDRSAEYARLQDRIENLQIEADKHFGTQQSDELEHLFRDIDVDSITKD